METLNNNVKIPPETTKSVQTDLVDVNKEQDELMRTLGNFLIDRILLDKEQGKLRFTKQKT